MSKHSSFYLVKSANQDFERFLAEKGKSLIKSSPRFDPKVDENFYKEITNSLKPCTLIPILNEKEKMGESINEKNEKSVHSQSNFLKTTSPKNIWGSFLSASMPENLQSKGVWKKTNPRINNLEDFSEVLHFREDEIKLSNDKLFDFYLNKDGGTFYQKVLKKTKKCNFST